MKDGIRGTDDAPIVGPRIQDFGGPKNLFSGFGRCGVECFVKGHVGACGFWFQKAQPTVQALSLGNFPAAKADPGPQNGEIFREKP